MYLNILNRPNDYFPLNSILKIMIRKIRKRLLWQTLFGMSTDTEMESVVDVASSPINTRKKEANLSSELLEI